jgi:hypothetical protein
VDALDFLAPPGQLDRRQRLVAALVYNVIDFAAKGVQGNDGSPPRARQKEETQIEAGTAGGGFLSAICVRSHVQGAKNGNRKTVKSTRPIFPYKRQAMPPFVFAGVPPGLHRKFIWNCLPVGATRLLFAVVLASVSLYHDRSVFASRISSGAPPNAQPVLWRFSNIIGEWHGKHHFVSEYDS